MEPEKAAITGRGKRASELIELIAVDLDGTLIGRSLQVSNRNAAAIRAAHEAGIHVTLSTGRMFQATMPFASELGITTPISCYQGAWIGEPLTGRRVFHEPVPLNLAREVVALAKERDYSVQIYLDDSYYVERLGPEVAEYERISQVPPKVVADLMAFMDREPTKIVMVTDEPTTAALVPELTSRFASRLHVTRSYPLFTEVVHPEVSKGQALRRLAGMLGVPLNKVMAIGDNLNDRELVEMAGFGVAMGNASEEVKAVAQFVTSDVDEDGVAVAIERFALGGYSAARA